MPFATTPTKEMTIELLNGNNIQDAIQHLKLFYQEDIFNLVNVSGNTYLFQNDRTYAMELSYDGSVLHYLNRGDAGDLVGGRIVWH